MGNTEQFGCKKCGAVIDVEVKQWSNRLEYRVQEANVRGSSSHIEIRCKKCGKPVAVVSVKAV